MRKVIGGAGIVICGLLLCVGLCVAVYVNYNDGPRPESDPLGWREFHGVVFHVGPAIRHDKDGTMYKRLSEEQVDIYAKVDGVWGHYGWIAAAGEYKVQDDAVIKVSKYGHFEPIKRSHGEWQR